MKRKKNRIRSILAGGCLSALLLAGCFLALLLAGCESREDLYVTKDGESADAGAGKDGEAADAASGENGESADAVSRENGGMADATSGENGENADVASGENGGTGSDLAGGQPGAEDQESGEAGGQADREEADIYVQVSGAVQKPGVYKLPAGSRIFEAVELAGGTTPEADLASVNQAQVLSDGQMIYVYAVGEEPRSIPGQAGQEETGESGQEAGDGRVNLNTASMEELMTLPGIGESKAEAILSWREENGGFDSVEDIMQIPGIKEGVFSKLEDRIKVD